MVTLKLYLLKISDDPRTMEEDSLILRVIEAYCTSAKTRNTVNSCEYIKVRSVICCPVKYLCIVVKTVNICFLMVKS